MFSVDTPKPAVSGSSYFYIGNIQYILSNVFLVIDSWGKREAGVMELRLQWLGSFDECLDSGFTININTHNFTAVREFEPQYCRTTLIRNSTVRVRSISKEGTLMSFYWTK